MDATINDATVIQPSVTMTAAELKGAKRAAERDVQEREARLRSLRSSTMRRLAQRASPDSVAMALNWHGWKEMHVSYIQPGNIIVGERARPLNEQDVVDLMASIKAIGQQQPITVRIVDGRRHLVSGLHRLEACRRLGLECDAAWREHGSSLYDERGSVDVPKMEEFRRKFIGHYPFDCTHGVNGEVQRICSDGSCSNGNPRDRGVLTITMTIPGTISRAQTENQARLAEIVENLHRSELTALQRAEHQVEYVRLFQIEQQQPDPLRQLFDEKEAERVRSKGEHKAAKDAVAEAKEKLAQLAQVFVGGRGKRGGISEAARSLGVTRDEVSRSIAVASIASEAKRAAVEAGLADNQKALLKVAKAEPAEQVAKVAEIVERKSAPRTLTKLAEEFADRGNFTDKERANVLRTARSQQTEVAYELWRDKLPPEERAQELARAKALAAGLMAKEAERNSIASEPEPAPIPVAIVEPEAELPEDAVVLNQRREAPPLPNIDAQVAAMKAAYRAGAPSARSEFLKWIEAGCPADDTE